MRSALSTALCPVSIPYKADGSVTYCLELSNPKPRNHSEVHPRLLYFHADELARLIKPVLWQTHSYTCRPAGSLPWTGISKENADGLVSSYTYLAFLHPGVGQAHPQCGSSAASAFNLMPPTWTLYPSRKSICFAFGEKKEIKSPNKWCHFWKDKLLKLLMKNATK